MAKYTKPVTPATGPVYMDPIACVVALVRLSAEHRTAVINLYRSTEVKDREKLFAYLTPRALEQVEAMAARWGDDEDAAVNKVHQHFPPPAYPEDGPEADKFPPLGNLMELYAGAREQGIIAPDEMGWVDACKAAVAAGVIEQERAGFKSGKRFVPSFKLAVTADIEATRKRLKGRQPAKADKATRAPAGLGKLIGQ